MSTIAGINMADETTNTDGANMFTLVEHEVTGHERIFSDNDYILDAVKQSSHVLSPLNLSPLLLSTTVNSCVIVSSIILRDLRLIFIMANHFLNFNNYSFPNILPKSILGNETSIFQWFK